MVIITIISSAIKYINSNDKILLSFFFVKNGIGKKLNKANEASCNIQKRLYINDLENSFSRLLNNTYGIYKFNLVNYAIAEKLSEFISPCLIRSLFLSYSIKVNMKNNTFNFETNKTINKAVSDRKKLIIIVYLILFISSFF